MYSASDTWSGSFGGGHGNRSPTSLYRELPVRLGRSTGEPQQQRTHDAGERHEHRDRIARQADEGCAGARVRSRDDAHRDRPARLDRDPPEHQPADLLDGCAHVIGFAGRNAAGRQHQIMLARGGGDGFGDRSRIVLEDAEVGHRRAQAVEQNTDAFAVLYGSGYEHVEVVGRTDVPEQVHGHPSDDHVLEPLAVQLGDERPEPRGKGHQAGALVRPATRALRS